ncbi:MAG: hypothetical protein ABIR15_05935 [Chitinophagaceae bacterium]
MPALLLYSGRNTFTASDCREIKMVFLKRTGTTTLRGLGKWDPDDLTDYTAKAVALDNEPEKEIRRGKCATLPAYCNAGIPKTSHNIEQAEQHLSLIEIKYSQ